MGVGMVTPASYQICNIWKPASLERRQLKLVIENPIINGMEYGDVSFSLFNVLETGACPVVFDSGNTRSPHFCKFVFHYDFMHAIFISFFFFLKKKINKSPFLDYYKL